MDQPTVSRLKSAFFPDDRKFLRGRQAHAPSGRELLEISVPVLIGRRTSAQKTQGDGTGARDLMPGSRRDEDGIAGAHRLPLAIQLHFPGAFQKKINFLREAVVMPLGGLTKRERGLGEGLKLHGSIRPVQQAADGGAVLGGKGCLGVAVLKGHGEGK